jgi:hypothetical protein
VRQNSKNLIAKDAFGAEMFLKNIYLPFFGGKFETVCLVGSFHQGCQIFLGA